MFSVFPESGTEPRREEGNSSPRLWLFEDQRKPPSPPPQQTDSSRKTFIYSQELCQLPHFSHQGQEEVPRLVELVPVSFSSKLSMEAAAGIRERGGSPGSRVRGWGKRRGVRAGISVMCNGGIGIRGYSATNSLDSLKQVTSSL